MLILQDATEFSYKRDKPELIGFTDETISRKDEAGRWRKHKVCGISMHSSLLVNGDGRIWDWVQSSSEPQSVQGDERVEEEDQPHARADRSEGELPVAGEPG